MLRMVSFCTFYIDAFTEYFEHRILTYQHRHTQKNATDNSLSLIGGARGHEMMPMTR